MITSAESLSFRLVGLSHNRTYGTAHYSRYQSQWWRDKQKCECTYGTTSPSISILQFLGQRCCPVSIRPTSRCCRPVAFTTVAAYTGLIQVIRVVRPTLGTWTGMFDFPRSPFSDSPIITETQSRPADVALPIGRSINTF